MAELFRAYIGDADREHLVAVFLDTQNRCVGVHTVSIGDIENAIVHPREVFKVAILVNAASVVLAHNHPSGDFSPSREDIESSKMLAKAGELLGIPVMDHVVVGQPGYASLLERGLLRVLWEDEEEKSKPKRARKKAKKSDG